MKQMLEETVKLCIPGHTKAKSKSYKILLYEDRSSWYYEYAQTVDGSAWLLVTISIPTNFLDYLRALYKWLQANENFGYKRVALILDNWSWHRAGVVMNFMMATGWNIFYLPPYSPQLAPVELSFNILKKRVAQKSKSRMVRLNKEDGYILLSDSLKAITKDRVQGWFRRFFWIFKELLPIFETKDAY